MIITPEAILNKLKTTGRPIALWGCGKVGRETLSYLYDKNLEVECFLDSNEVTQGKYIEGRYKIFAPTLIISAKTHFVIIASIKYSLEMISELKRYGYNEYIDFVHALALFGSSIIGMNEGYCLLCDSPTIFIENGESLRDGYRCWRCGSIPRQRAIVRTINRFIPEWNELTIHECSPNEIFISFFGSRCNKYTYSKFWPDITPGSSFNNVLCEDLEKLTFQDNSIDIFITQDVFEHVFNPQAAFQQIERVLKVGGYHIFSVPIYENNPESIQKARKNSAGMIEFLSEPEHHGPSLVTYHFGLDIIDYISSDMLTTILIEKDRHFGIDGNFLHIFVCRKKA